MTMLIMAAASAAGHTGCGMAAAMPQRSSPLAEFSSRDKSGTTGWLGHQALSQVTVYSGLAKGRSFLAEGTRLELATGYPAPHFQCGR
jgi:hypothetical protein